MDIGQRLPCNSPSDRNLQRSGNHSANDPMGSGRPNLWQTTEAVLPTFVESMEHHGHVCLDVEVRDRLLRMSAPTIDRLLRPVRATAKQGRRKASLNTPLRKSINIRTYDDWKNPPPGYFEMDAVAHCAISVAGNHIHSLVLTDIASVWTEAAALIESKPWLP